MKFIDGAIILSFCTALLYCASTVFTHGFMSVLRLDTDVLDRNLHQIIYHGMILTLAPIVIGPMVIFLASFVRSAIILEISSQVRKKFSLARKVSKVLKFLSFRHKKNKTDLEKKHIQLNATILKLAVLSFAFLCFMYYLEKQGKEHANLLLKNINAGKYHEVDVPASGVKAMASLFCGARNCAAINPTTKEIIYFPQEGHIIRSK
jgi:hypothetical protein